MGGRSSLSAGPTLLPELALSISILSKVEGQRREKIAAARDRKELQQHEKIIEPMISSGKMADMIRRISPAGQRRRRHRVRRRPACRGARLRGWQRTAIERRSVGCKNVESPPLLHSKNLISKCCPAQPAPDAVTCPALERPIPTFMILELFMIGGAFFLFIFMTPTAFYYSYS